MSNQKPSHSQHKASQKAHSQTHRSQKRANDKRARQKENRAKAAAHQSAVGKRRRRARWLTYAVVAVVVIALPLSLIADSLIRASTDLAVPESPCPTVRLPKAEERDEPQPPSDVVSPEGRYTATMETSCGSMTFELLAAEATVDVNNFVYLARKGFYDNTIFHRVIRDFVIQGGDPTAPGSPSPGTGGPGYRYTGTTPQTPGFALGDLAMANSGDPSSNGSQFFIVVGPQGQNLPPNYSLFGRITSGLDVAQKIATVPTEPSPADVPAVPVVINKVTISSVDTN
jgi:cyclophilin family peptidyl-prolyl cis-trans isomerase